MPPELDIAQLIGWGIGLLSVFVSIVVGLFKMLLGQFEKRLEHRFQTLTAQVNECMQRIEQNDTALHDMEKSFLRWQAELPMQYVRREDFIRNQTVIEAKLDALFAKMDLICLRGNS